VRQTYYTGVLNLDARIKRCKLVWRMNRIKLNLSPRALWIDFEEINQKRFIYSLYDKNVIEISGSCLWQAMRLIVLDIFSYLFTE